MCSFSAALKKPQTTGDAPAWAPAPASAAGCTAALPRFPVPCCAPANTRSTQDELLEQLPWPILANHVGSFLEIPDWLKLLCLSRSLRRRILTHIGYSNNDFTSLAWDDDDGLWQGPHETVSGHLSPSRFKNMDRKLGLRQVEEERLVAPLGIARLELGGWFNHLTATQESFLWFLLSKCDLQYVTITSDFYHCTCACCVKTRITEENGEVSRPVRLAAESPEHHAALTTPRPPGSPGRTPYRRTHSARWRTRQRHSSTPRPASARLPRRNRTFNTSPGTSLHAFSGQQSRQTNRPDDFREMEEQTLALSRRAESAPRQLLEDQLPSSPSIASVVSSQQHEQKSDGCNDVARRHSVSRIFWLFRTLIFHRPTIKYFDFGAPPAVCRTCALAAAALPEFPVPMRLLQGKIKFEQLERLHFGPAVDCRYIVPFIDFCTFHKLWHLEILGLPLTYTESQPQFGKEPTLVFGPQYIFSSDEPAPLWLPAVYNGRIDGQLQLQGRGVYASREYRYEGNFRDGRNQGQGLMVSTCGETYRGEWTDGRRHGEGVVTQADGRRLEGEWYKDSLHGRGSMRVSGGLNYDGEWKHGVLDGWGVMTNKDGALLAFGQFRNGRSHGWVVHRCDKVNTPSIVLPSDSEEHEEMSGDDDSWEVASILEGESPLRFPVETASVTAGNLCVPPKEFQELLKQRDENRLVYRIHHLPGWRGVWKKSVGMENDDDALAADQQILLLSSKNSKQLAPGATGAIEIEEVGDPPADIPLWMDKVLAKLRIEGL